MNKSRFERAAEFLKNERSVECVIPLNLDHTKGNETGKWEDYMRVCIAALVECEAIAVLDDWFDSRGARMEVEIARGLGMSMLVLNDTEDKVVRVIEN
ncbi:MAG: DUF4406 domain-containing protein [Sphingobacteriaceae bacterium]|nr:DUF4406 domain-containing protein [Sphingobacteriaceae bacterium]